MIKKIVKTVFSFLEKPKVDVNSLIIDKKEYVNLFFGYYDLCPFSISGDQLLLHGQKRWGDKSVDILIYSLKTKEWRVVGSTTSWNYQQGARLFWVSETVISYNKAIGLEHVSCLVDIETGNELEICPVPTQVSGDDFVISINYSYLNQIGSEYGYADISDIRNHGDILQYSRVDKNIKRLVSIGDCINILGLQDSDVSNPQLNHVLLNKNETGFIFIFRYYEYGKRIDSLLFYDLNLNSLKVLIKNQIISHCTWKNNSTLLFWGIIGNIKGYYWLDVQIKESLELAFDFLHDGHPTLLNDDLMISDTYPNKFLKQELFLFDFKSETKTLLNEQRHYGFYESYDRCDFHPSVSKDGTLYQIDVRSSKGRKVIVGKIDKV